MSENVVIKNNFNLIRLIAALQVLIVHACNHFGYDSILIKALKCFPGVPLFFFVSGYLIGGTYIKNHAKGLKVFFKNRILRLYPALILCTVIGILMTLCTGYFNTISFTFGQFIFWFFGQISFYQFYNPDFMRGYGTGVLNGALWTIAVEIQFYVLTPIIFYLFRKQKILVFILFFISLAFNIYIKINSNWDLMYIKLLTVSSLPWLYMFLIGYFFSYYKQWHVYIDRLNIVLVLALYILSMFLVGSYTRNAMNSINPISVFLLSILIFKFSKLQLRLPRQVQKFIDGNDISYGIYIYHMPIINTLIYINIFSLTTNIFLTLVSVIVFAYISWISIEKRMLGLKK